MKRQLKQAVRAGALAAGRFSRNADPVFRILTYHSVGEREHEMNVRVPQFERQLDWLVENACCCRLGDVLNGTAGVALTFDDGYRDNLLHAAPRLAARGIDATVFVVPGRIGGYLDHDVPNENSALLGWDEIRELAQSGVDIGAHTMSHARLSTLDEVEQRREIADSKARLEDELGREVTAFAYPYGSSLDYDERSHALVRECGYTIAVTNRYGVNRAGDDPFLLRRINIDATDTLDSFAAKVSGRLDALAVAESRIGIRARRWGNRLLGH